MAGIESVEQRLELITRWIPAEGVHGVELIKAALMDEGKTLRCLWCAYIISFSSKNILLIS